LSQGLDVDGVDNSPEMLAICLEKAQLLGLSPNLYQQGMESLQQDEDNELVAQWIVNFIRG